MLVSEIINIIQEQTRDTDGVTWTDGDIVGYVNEAVKSTIQRVPQSSSKKELVNCVSGVDQVLPADAVVIINVVANDLTTLGKLGSIIHQTDVIAKDAYSPNWRSTKPSAVVIEWMKRSEPTQFIIWPPLDSNRKLLVEYSFYPADAVSASSTVNIHNDYLEEIRTWCLYRTFARDSENTPSVERAAMYKQQYEALVQQ